MITICYITARKNPLFDWFLKGFIRQRNQFADIPMQLLIVDLWKEERVLDLELIPNTQIDHITPLPSVWQGKHRLTKDNWFTAANARNTAFVYAIHPTIAFVDDLTVLGDQWMEAVIDAAKNNYCALGAYQKQVNMVVEDGRLISGEVKPDGHDSRWHLTRDNSKVKVRGDLLYGCSFVVPLENCLQINGFDHLTDSIGYEDQGFGKRLEKTGVKFYYDKRLFTVESNDHFSTDEIMLRHDPVLNGSYYPTLNRFGINQSIYSEPFNKDCSHIIVECASKQSPMAVYNPYSLRTLRAKREAGEEIQLADLNYSDRTWYDNQLLTEK